MVGDDSESSDLRTYEMTQNIERPPEPERSSSIGMSDSNGSDDAVAVGSVKNGSKDTVGSRAKSALSRQAKRSISDGVVRFVAKREKLHCWLEKKNR